MEDRKSSHRSAVGWLMICMLSAGLLSTALHAAEVPFAPGERLEYELRWENIPAGSACLEVSSMKTINGEMVYHFVLTAQSNAFIDLFFKVRDRIDAYADLAMTCSVHYEKKQNEGRHKRDEVVVFDWDNSQARYTNHGKPRAAIALLAGSFDPLSAFYFSRTVAFDIGRQLERPITDGRKNVIGRLRVVARETITLQNGDRHDTFLVEPELNHVGGVFKESKDARILLWVTADQRRIPVRIKSKVVVGHFIGELTSAQTAH
jgi:hypothetical protein